MAYSDDLLKQLDNDVHTLKQLKEMLDQEQDALKVNDLETLQRIHPEKHTCLEQLRHSARQKVHLLVQMGFRPDSGIETSQFIQSLGKNALTERWQQAHQALAECQFVNEVNGRVIAHLQRRVERLTTIIRGQDAQPKLYGKEGRETGLGGSMLVASA